MIELHLVQHRDAVGVWLTIYDGVVLSAEDEKIPGLVAFRETQRTFASWTIRTFRDDVRDVREQHSIIVWRLRLNQPPLALRERADAARFTEKNLQVAFGDAHQATPKTSEWDDRSIALAI